MMAEHESILLERVQCDFSTTKRKMNLLLLLLASRAQRQYYMESHFRLYILILGQFALATIGWRAKGGKGEKREKMLKIEWIAHAIKETQ